MPRETKSSWIMRGVAILMTVTFALPVTALAATGPANERALSSVTQDEGAMTCDGIDDPQCVVDRVNLCLAGDPVAAPKCLLQVFHEICEYNGPCPFLRDFVDGVRTCLTSLKTCVAAWPRWSHAVPS